MHLSAGLPGTHASMQENSVCCHIAAARPEQEHVQRSLADFGKDALLPQHTTVPDKWHLQHSQSAAA